MIKDLLLKHLTTQFKSDFKDLDKKITTAAVRMKVGNCLSGDPVHIVHLAQSARTEVSNNPKLALLAALYLRVTVPEINRHALSDNSIVKPEFTEVHEYMSGLAALPYSSFLELCKTINGIYDHTGINLYEVWDLTELDAKTVIRLTKGLHPTAMTVLSYWMTLTGREDIFDCGSITGLINFIEDTSDSNLHVNQPDRYREYHNMWASPHPGTSPHDANPSLPFPLSSLRVSVEPDDAGGYLVLVSPYGIPSVSIPNGIIINVTLTESHSNLVFNVTVNSASSLNQWRAKLDTNGMALPKGIYQAALTVEGLVTALYQHPLRID